VRARKHLKAFKNMLQFYVKHRLSYLFNENIQFEVEIFVPKAKCFFSFGQLLLYKLQPLRHCSKRTRTSGDWFHITDTSESVVNGVYTIVTAQSRDSNQQLQSKPAELSGHIPKYSMH
jgi:hypothetical protein